MIKRLISVTALLCASFAFAQTKTPLVNPHWSFVDNSGAACANCQLSTYLAGTTTPTPTYTDSTGTSQNTNPIILDASGSAMIWVGTPTIKLVMKDALGNLLWTADNIPGNGSGSGGCGFAGSITFENSTLTGLDCDQYITINKTLHTVNVGGPLSATHFTMTNLGTMTAGWILDITSPEAHAKTGCGGTAGASKYCDGGTGDWTTLPITTGTVTSVAASTTGAPLTVSGSPITSSGTLAFTLGVTGTGNKTATATAAGTSGNCAQWDASGNLGDAGAACALGSSSLTANGYQIFGSGLIMQWAQGTSMSSSAVTQDINFPTACLTQVFIVIPSSYESVFDDTSMPVFVVISNTLTKATVAMQRVPDHGYNAATPYIEVLCK